MNGEGSLWMNLENLSGSSGGLHSKNMSENISGYIWVMASFLLVSSIDVSNVLILTK
jgi:hypothetical protein